MAAFPSPSRGAKVTEGPEHPRSPSPAQPRLLFSCQNPPHPHHPDSPGNQLLRETATLQRSHSGIFRERQNAFGVARLGGGMWRDHGLGDASANEGSEKRSKAAV